MALRLLLLASLAACGSETAPAMPDAGILPYDKLSTYGFFKGNGSTQDPNPGVVAYEVNAPLFADFAAKHRFIVLPAMGKISYRPDDKWVFPTGTMIVKTFAYGARLIETRVLILTSDGWLPTTYLWNDEQTEATLMLVGARVPVSYGDPPQSLEYRVPNQNQCYGCHGQPGHTNVLGLRTRQLNRDGQIDRFASLGMFDGAVPSADQRAALPDPYADGPLEPRARAWLEANCAHCHSPGGAAGATNLYLTVDVSKPIDYGICRIPNAAGDGAGGRKFDIVAGHPDQSVLSFRIASTVPGIKMPEMPIQLVDQPGVDVVNAWIASLPETTCQ